MLNNCQGTQGKGLFGFANVTVATDSINKIICIFKELETGYPTTISVCNEIVTDLIGGRRYLMLLNVKYKKNYRQGLLVYLQIMEWKML